MHFFVKNLIVVKQTLNSNFDFLQAPFLEHLLGNVSVLNVLEEPMHAATMDYCKLERNYIVENVNKLW